MHFSGYEISVAPNALSKHVWFVTVKNEAGTSQGVLAYNSRIERWVDEGAGFESSFLDRLCVVVRDSLKSNSLKSARR